MRIAILVASTLLVGVFGDHLVTTLYNDTACHQSVWEIEVFDNSTSVSCTGAPPRCGPLFTGSHLRSFSTGCFHGLTPQYIFPESFFVRYDFPDKNCASVNFTTATGHVTGTCIDAFERGQFAEYDCRPMTIKRCMNSCTDASCETASVPSGCQVSSDGFTSYFYKCF
jgi:hypothetical protein